MADWLWNGQTPSSFTGNSTSTTNLPDWYSDATKALIQKSSAAAGTPYQAYTGPRVAGFTQPQQQSFNMTQANVGNYQPAFNAAGNNFAQAGQTALNPSTFASYMNPYTSQVVDTIQQLGNRNLTENVLPGVNSTFTSNGQFGSSRNADFTNRAIRDNQQAISNAQGQALSSGFGQSLQAYGDAQNRALQAGQGNLALGSAQQSAGLKDTAALNAIGTQQQQQTQQNLDTAYGDFQNQLNYPYQQANFMSGIIRGTPTGQTTTTSTQNSGTQGSTSNPLGSILGAGAGILGALGSSGALSSIGNWLGFAEGGPVRKPPKMASGGSFVAPRGPVAHSGVSGRSIRTSGLPKNVVPGAAKSPVVGGAKVPKRAAPKMGGTASMLKSIASGAQMPMVA